MPRSDFDFLSHSGELSGLISSMDWSATSLGSPPRWPQSTKTTVALILQSPLPIVTLWGEAGVMIYNDAYSVFAGGRHPELLGSKVREGWPEVAEFNDNVMKVGLAGGTLRYTDQELTLHRNGVPEQVFMDLSYSPIIGEDGHPVGVMSVVVETTAKVRAERHSLGERDRLKQMFEQAPGFMAIVSEPDHRFEMTNDSYQRLVGRRDLIGKPLMVAMPEMADQTFRCLLDQVYATGTAVSGQATSVRLERKSGHVEERFVDFVFQPILGDDREPKGIFVQGRDVTERVYSEVALRRETRLLSVLNSLGADLAAELDLEKVVKKITDAGVDLTGAEFGAFFYNVLNDDGESYMLYSLSGVAQEMFSQFPMPRATTLFQPTFKGEGVIRSDDITVDERYGKSGPHRGMPSGHLPVRSYLAVPVISRSSEVIGALLFGHSSVGVFRQEHEDLVVGAAGLAAIAMDNARLFQAVERELTERTAAEEKLHILNSSLEERVALETAGRMKTEQALRQAQKMEAIGQLTGGVAHDFNNLLQVVSGNLQLLLKDIAGNPSAERRVDNALAGVARGSKLASQLLAFGRRQALEPRVVNIGRFVGGMEDMLRRTLGEGVEIETIGSGGLWNTLVDPTQVENAILNLAINARDAMEGNGKLTIEVGNTVLDDSYARQHDDVKTGQYVMLAVTDTGSGMSEDTMAKVFEPFFSTKPVDKGTGLGLSMVYGFVKQSGGHIKIYSELGEGTTIKLYFPRVQRDEDVVFESDAGPISGGTETILVAEDDEQVRATVVEMLTDLGYRVLKARDAEAALIIVDSGVSIDLLFTDVIMPGALRSRELARLARQRMPGIGVLYTSGYTENSIVHGGRLDAGVELLSKPYTREALARKVRNVLDDGKHQAVAPEPKLQLQQQQQSRPDVHGTSLQVLVVEDDVLIRMATAEMIIEHGYAVIEAGSGEEAIKLLEGNAIDVVVTDLGLPGISGEQLAACIFERWPRIGLVFATGMDSIPKYEGHRTAMVQKPFGDVEIGQAISQVAPRRVSGA